MKAASWLTRPKSKRDTCWCGRTRTDGGPEWTTIFQCSPKCAAIPEAKTRAIVLAWRAEDALPVSGSVVYAIASEGQVKFGISTNLKQRFESLQGASPVPLRVVGWRPGKRRDETLLHQAFARCRLHGEWFSQTPRVVAFLKEIRRGRDGWVVAVAA